MSQVSEALEAAGEPLEEGSGLSYSVPTGNFGDVLAGYYAKRMGLPVDRLVVAVNENDILHRYVHHVDTQTTCFCDWCFALVF